MVGTAYPDKIQTYIFLLKPLKSRYYWTFAQLTSLHWLRCKRNPRKIQVKMTAAVSADITELRNFPKIELIARGRSTPDLDGLLQQKGQHVFDCFKQTGMKKRLAMWLC